MGMSRQRERWWKAQALAGFVASLASFWALYALFGSTVAFWLAGAALATLIGVFVLTVIREI